MRVSLADIFVDGVVSDESGRIGSGSVALGVEKLGCVIHVWQERCAALHPVFFRNAEFGQRGMILGIDFAGAGESILQRERKINPEYHAALTELGIAKE